MLVTHENILRRFSKNFEWATRVDLAVAWVTDNKGLRALHERAPSLDIRAVVGFSGTHNNITEPAALNTLSAMGQLRRTAVNSRLFHPKVYVFRGADRSVAWIGSANFTDGGFGKNEEVLIETSNTEDVESWFDRLWGQCYPLDECAINCYQAHRRINPLPAEVDESWVPPDPPHSPPVPEFEGWTPPASWWEQKWRQSSLMTFYLCRPGGIAWSEMPSITRKYNDKRRLSTFEDGEWRTKWRSHAREFLVKPHCKFLDFDADGDRGKIVLKSSRPLRRKELVEMIDGVRSKTVGIKDFLTDREN